MSQVNAGVSMETVLLGTVSLGVGIDTARYGHHVSFLDEQKRSAAKSFHFTESAAGYQQFQAVLQKLAEKHPGVHFHIRLDAAGQYAENLVQWLHRLPFDTTISVGQPARNKAYRQVHFDKRKADPTESLACARFAIVERPAATPHNPPEFQQLRDAVALMESSAKQRTRLINQLHGLLARVFPELAVHVTDLSANWVLSLLEKYPTPDKLARAKPETLINIPHLAADMAETLRSAAAQSTGSNCGPIAAELILQKVHAIRQEQAAFAALADLVEQAWQALPEGPARRIRTIPGIGLQTSAALVAKIVSIDRFATPTALIGYFGIFPEEVDVSGTDRQGNPKKGTEIHMSRKGNDLVRRLLYTAAQCAVSWNPPVKALFARQRAEGKEYNLCLGHCMAKLLRQVFAVWTKDCDFDCDFESRLRVPTSSPDFESRLRVPTSSPDFESRPKVPTESRPRIQRASPEKRDATGLKGRGPVETRGHHDVPNSPSSERPSAGCASAEPTSIRPEARHSTRRERMRQSHATPPRQEKQLAFSILQNFRSIVPRHSSSCALSDHQPTRLKSQHQNPRGITPHPN